QQRAFADQIGSAPLELVDRRPVVGWRATRGRRDVGITEAEAVVPALRGRHAREARAVHRAHQPEAAVVAGEHAPGAVSAVRRRCQADDQQPRAWIADPRQWAAPVRVAEELTTLDARHELA